MWNRKLILLKYLTSIVSLIKEEFKYSNLTSINTEIFCDKTLHLTDCVCEIVFPTQPPSQLSKLWKGVFVVAGIMTTLITYDVFQEKIMRVSYGDNKAFFKYSLFLVFYNRITTSVVWNGVRDGQIPIGYR
ncbi:hypothetical protein DVH24_000690 [Malus domestica]|uniref:Uncharacterized protein n=1 Tax=Malus domestica TaxID=3750 RepID=A0A498JYY5_MALDO|nr:hypothetical protein DVH24_000690 [Malus domestica]